MRIFDSQPEDMSESTCEVGSAIRIIGQPLPFPNEPELFILMGRSVVGFHAAIVSPEYMEDPAWGPASDDEETARSEAIEEYTLGSSPSHKL
jgi:hypothetical protein